MTIAPTKLRISHDRSDEPLEKGIAQVAAIFPTLRSAMQQLMTLPPQLLASAMPYFSVVTSFVLHEDVSETELHENIEFLADEIRSANMPEEYHEMQEGAVATLMRAHAALEQVLDQVHARRIVLLALARYE